MQIPFPATPFAAAEGLRQFKPLLGCSQYSRHDTKFHFCVKSARLPDVNREWIMHHVVEHPARSRAERKIYCDSWRRLDGGTLKCFVKAREKCEQFPNPQSNPISVSRKSVCSTNHLARARRSLERYPRGVRPTSARNRRSSLRMPTPSVPAMSEIESGSESFCSIRSIAR